MTEKSQFKSMLTKANDIYFPMIQNQLEDNSIEMDDYSKKCVMNSISAINETLDSAGIDWSNEQLDQSNLTEIFLTVASLKLNASASPNEVYFQIRNKKTNSKNDRGQYVWKKQIEMGIEGDGNDAILSRFGRGVKQVMKFWEVRENDKFEYPFFNGLEMSPPKWQPTGQGKVIRVVYPLIMRNDIVEYHIAERSDVVRNLIAHVNNNLMKETFGIAKSTYDATREQRKKINDKKQEILNKIDGLGLDKALDNEELQQYISPAWKSLQSRESMIVRKMRNNIVKKIPKDFGSVLAEMSFDKTSSHDESIINQEVNSNANREVLDFDDGIEEVEFEEVAQDEKPKKTEGKKADFEVIDEQADLKQNDKEQGQDDPEVGQPDAEAGQKDDNSGQEKDNEKENAEQIDFNNMVEDDVPF